MTPSKLGWWLLLYLPLAMDGKVLELRIMTCKGNLYSADDASAGSVEIQAIHLEKFGLQKIEWNKKAPAQQRDSARLL